MQNVYYIGPWVSSGQESHVRQANHVLVDVTQAYIYVVPETFLRLHSPIFHWLTSAYFNTLSLSLSLSLSLFNTILSLSLHFQQDTLFFSKLSRELSTWNFVWNFIFSILLLCDVFHKNIFFFSHQLPRDISWPLFKTRPMQAPGSAVIDYWLIDWQGYW